MSIDQLGILKQKYVNPTFKKTEDTESSSVRNNYAHNSNFDKVEIRKKHNSKQDFFTRAIKGMTVGLVLMYGTLVLRNKLTKPSLNELQTCFKELLGRDLSQEEFKTLLNEYKKIIKTKDTEEYTKRLINQVKTDYGLKNVKTNLNIGFIQANVKNDVFYRGTTTPYGDIKVNRDILEIGFLIDGKHQIFRTAFHELKHLQQWADSYRADADKFTEVLVNNAKKIETEAFNKDVEYTIKDNKAKGIDISRKKAEKLVTESLREQIRKKLDNLYKDLPKYKKGTPEYNKGMKYMENYANYIEAHKDMDNYLKQIMEKEAYDCEAKADKIYKYHASIWKIF